MVNGEGLGEGGDREEFNRLILEEFPNDLPLPFTDQDFALLSVALLAEKNLTMYFEREGTNLAVDCGNKDLKVKVVLQTNYGLIIDFDGLESDNDNSLWLLLGTLYCSDTSRIHEILSSNISRQLSSLVKIVSSQPMRSEVAQSVVIKSTEGAEFGAYVCTNTVISNGLMLLVPVSINSSINESDELSFGQEIKPEKSIVLPVESIIMLPE